MPMKGAPCKVHLQRIWFYPSIHQWFSLFFLASYGANTLPPKESETLLELVWEALQDKTLIMLIVAALVSLALGIHENPSTGWIEGTAILVAVALVVTVGATNDYQKVRNQEIFRRQTKIPTVHVCPLSGETIPRPEREEGQQECQGVQEWGTEGDLHL